MPSKKNMKTFAAAILLGVTVSCAYSFDYIHYAARVAPAVDEEESYVGTLERIDGPEDGSEDLDLSALLPRDDDMTPYVCLPRAELRRLEEDIVDLRTDLARCKNRR